MIKFDWKSSDISVIGADNGLDVLGEFSAYKNYHGFK